MAVFIVRSWGDGPVDTAWLEDFLAVLTEGGFSRAADRRGVSQPALSRRIRALEDWVGAFLFARNTHSVRLTRAGERLLPAAEEMLRRLEIGRLDALAASHEASETLRLAATHVLSLTFFPAWLRALEAITPSTATVQLTADNMVACEKLMVEGRAQFLLCHHHPAAATRLTPDVFSSILVGHDVLMPVAAPGFAADTPHLAYTSESGMGRILAASWLARGKSAPRSTVFSSHLASVLAAMAREGRGVAWAPRSLIADDLAAGRLMRTEPENDDVPMEIRLFRPKARQAKTAETLWGRALSLHVQADKNVISSDSVSSGRSS